MKHTFSKYFSTSTLLQGTQVLFDHGIISVTSFLTGIILARSTSKEDFAFYVLAMLFVVTIDGLLRALITIPYATRYNNYDLQRRREYLGNTLIFLTTAFLCVVFLSLIAHSLFRYSEVTTFAIEFSPEQLLLCLLISLPYTIREHTRSALLTTLRTSITLNINIISALFHLTIITIFFAQNNLTTTSVLLTWLLSSTLAATLSIYMLRNELRFRISLCWYDFKSSWQTAKWHLINAIGFIGASQSIPFLLLAFSTSNSVAVFGVCFAFSGLVSPIVRGANGYILPRMVQTKEKASKLVSIMHKSMLLLSIPFGIWLVVGISYGDELVTFLYTDHYSGFGILIALLVSKFFLDSIGTPLTTILQVVEKPRNITIALCVSMFITLSIGPLLIINYDLVGAASALLLSSLVGVLWKLYVVYDYKKVNSEHE